MRPHEARPCARPRGCSFRLSVDDLLLMFGAIDVPSRAGGRQEGALVGLDEEAPVVRARRHEPQPLLRDADRKDVCDGGAGCMHPNYLLLRTCATAIGGAGCMHPNLFRTCATAIASTYDGSVRLIVSKTKTPPGRSTRRTCATAAGRSRAGARAQ